jgi:hypothetical protein
MRVSVASLVWNMMMVVMSLCRNVLLVFAVLNPTVGILSLLVKKVGWI